MSQQLPGRKLFVFDEAGLLFSPNFHLYLTHPVRSLIETGREWQIDTLFAAQEPKQVANGLRAQLDQIISFQLNATAADPLAKDYGFDAGKITRLKVGRAISYDFASGEFSDLTAKPDNETHPKRKPNR